MFLSNKQINKKQILHNYLNEHCVLITLPGGSSDFMLGQLFVLSQKVYYTECYKYLKRVGRQLSMQYRLLFVVFEHMQDIDPRIKIIIPKRKYKIRIKTIVKYD